MSTKDISDKDVCCAYAEAWKRQDKGELIWPTTILMERTGEPEKVCMRAMERSQKKGLIEYGVSLRAGWLTDEGKKFIN